VPPFQFFAYIFNNGALVRAMEKIRSNSSKYSHFVSGSKSGLCDQCRSDCFPEQVQGFARYLHVDPEILEKILLAGAKGCSDEKQNQCFRTFFEYLITQKSKNQCIKKK
jgi:hypothetical protein